MSTKEHDTLRDEISQPSGAGPWRLTYGHRHGNYTTAHTRHLRASLESMGVHRSGSVT